MHSTLAALAATTIPCLYSVSELDPPEFQLQAIRVMEEVFAVQGQLPQLAFLVGHNHLSSVLQVGSDVDSLGPVMAEFIERAR